MRSQLIEFAADNGSLRAELMIPEGEALFPGVVLCHGFGSDHRAMRPTALRISRQGVATLSFDFRGHGKSSGFLDGHEARDVTAALEHLRHHPRIDPERIGLVGHSLGAVAAASAAAEAKYLRALVFLSLPLGTNQRSARFLSAVRDTSARVGSHVLEYPRHGPLPGASRFEGVMCVLWMRLRNYRLQVDWEKSLEIWSKLGVVADIEKLGASPKLFVHCKGDKIAPYKGVVELYNKVAPPKELLDVERGFHSSPLLPGRLRKRWISWLVSTLTL